MKVTLFFFFFNLQERCGNFLFGFVVKEIKHFGMKGE